MGGQPGRLLIPRLALGAILALLVVQCASPKPQSMPYRVYLPIVTIGQPGGW